MNLLRVLGAASCLTFASCALWPYENSHEAAKRDGEGYSLDNPATGSRYMAGADNAAAPGAPTDPGVVVGPAPSVSSETGGIPSERPSATTGSTPGPTSTVTPPPPPAPQPSTPTFGTPVPGRRGFVYPPGVESKPENMVDVRDFNPGDKVRDPRTGKIFLVP